MTTRSTKSSYSTKERMTDGDVYVFLLQVAYYAYLGQSRAEIKAAKARESIAAASVQSTSSSKKNSESSKGDGWMGLSGLADMVSAVGSSSKSAKFPEKLIKRLNDRLELIAMGRDQHFKDQSLRQTIGIFYGTFKETSFQKQMKENRKIEELILIFVTTAQASLKKRLPGDEWKEELNNQVGHFVRIIRECLKTVSGVPKELTERLDVYSAKLVPSTPSGSNGNSSANTISPGSANQSRRASAATVSSIGANPVGESVLIRTVGELFNVNLDQLQKDVDFVKKSCTEQVSHLKLSDIVTIDQAHHLLCFL